MKIFDSGQLRIARRNAGLTIREAANALFLSASSVANKENGVVKVFAEELPAFAEIYGVNLDLFFVEKLDMTRKKR